MNKLFIEIFFHYRKKVSYVQYCLYQEVTLGVAGS